MRRSLPAAALLLASCTDWNARRADPVDGGAPLQEQRCPGDPGCPSGGTFPILAGYGTRSVAPRGFERPNPAYLDATDCDPAQVEQVGATRCGNLPTVIRDCGRDGLCPGAAGYPGPDDDGSEGDGPRDYFLDCGLDALCPGDPGYTAPDADGTEGDGVFQAAWVAGYGNNRPALGIHDVPDVRCMALSTGDTGVVLCALDAVGLFRDEVLRARARLEERLPGEVDYLAVMNSHTHESIDTIGQWGRADPLPGSPGRLPGHNAFLVDQVAAAAADAWTTRVPVTLRMVRGQTGREGFLHDGRAPIVFNDDLTLLEAVPASGGCLFSTVHWSNHPEILGSLNNLLSADFVAPLRDAVTAGLSATATWPALEGRHCPTLFFNGTVGGLMAPLHVDITARDGTPYPDAHRTYARMTAYAENLAQVVLETWQGTPATEVTSGEIRLATRELLVPTENTLLLTGFRLGLFDRDAFDPATGAPLDGTFPAGRAMAVKTEAFVLRLGPWAAAGVPGEMFPETAVGGLDGSRSQGEELVPADQCDPQDRCASSNAALPCPTLRPPGGWRDCACEACRLCRASDVANAPGPPYLLQRLGVPFPVVLGLANDEVGYLVPAWQWQVSQVQPYLCEATDHYEETNSLGPESGARVESTVDALLPALVP